MKRLVIQPFSTQFLKIIGISAVFLIGGVWIWVAPVSGRRAGRWLAEEQQNLAGLLAALIGLAGLGVATWMASSPTAILDEKGIQVYRPRKFFVSWSQIDYVNFEKEGKSIEGMTIFLKERGQFPDNIEYFLLKDNQEIGYLSLDLSYATPSKVADLKAFLKKNEVPTKRP